MTKKDAEIVISLAHCDFNATKAAERLHYHANTLLNHINQIKAETGIDPRSFHGMCKLLPAARATLQGTSSGVLDLEIVTRCKDCEFWLEEYGEVCSREEDWFYMSPGDFCSKAAMRG